MANLLTLKILDGYTRPVVSLGKMVKCLIDTGLIFQYGQEVTSHCRGVGIFLYK